MADGSPRPHQFGITETFAGILCETLLYGGFLVVSYECGRLLYRRAREGKAHWYLTATFIALFIMISMRTIVDLKRTIVSFTNPSNTGMIDMGGPQSFESVATNILLVLIAVVADAFLIYRVHIVWQNSFLIIILPVILLFGTAAGGILANYALWKASITDPSSFALVNTGFEVCLAFTVACNGLCSILIAGLILYVRDKSGTNLTATDSVSRIVSVMVESAAVYTMVLVAEIIAIVRKSPLTYFFINLMGPLVGLVFTYIIIRAARRSRSWENSDTYVSNGPDNASAAQPQFRSLGASQRVRTLDTSRTGVGMVPVQIQLDTFKQVTGDHDLDIESGIDRDLREDYLKR
ncbi:hypothetical protein BKA62DRAFT_314607 [Auriculariales sp. MPI-PUGE-AT-0066]|nr:hypothetical protein BKA62DRAFT_314607 [Auriculariales sp. MPI-PUGE-AT-0066]